MNHLKLIICDNKALLYQICAGSKDAFNALYEQHCKKAYYGAYNHIRYTDAVKDVVQELFTHIWAKRETFFNENLPVYLNITLQNKVFKFLDEKKS